MILLRSTLAVSVLACMSATAWAQGAPKQLYNKSVTLSWAQSGSLKIGGQVRPSSSATYSRQVYISSGGRLFVRATRHGSGHHSKSEHGPGDNMTPGGGGLRFQGNRLVGVLALASGAVQATAAFDPGFTNCTLDVILGKSAGAGMKIQTPVGMGEVVSIAVVHPTCKITNGNVFASH
jgi:hypothetical protein